MLSYQSIDELCRKATEEKKKISEIVLSDEALQMEQSEDELFSRMTENFKIMCEAVNAGKQPDLRSASGLTGGDAAKMEKY